MRDSALAAVTCLSYLLQEKRRPVSPNRDEGHSPARHRPGVRSARRRQCPSHCSADRLGESSINRTMIMFNDTMRTRSDGLAVPRECSNPQGRQVRTGLLSWPPVALAGMIVAAAIVLFGHGDGCKQTRAIRTMIGNGGTVESIAFRPDGAMLSSVGVDGSMAVLDLTARSENRTYPGPRPGLLCRLQPRQQGSGDGDGGRDGLSSRSGGP